MEEELPETPPSPSADKSFFGTSEELRLLPSSNMKERSHNFTDVSSIQLPSSKDNDNKKNDSKDEESSAKNHHLPKNPFLNQFKFLVKQQHILDNKPDEVKQEPHTQSKQEPQPQGSNSQEHFSSSASKEKARVQREDDITKKDFLRRTSSHEDKRRSPLESKKESRRESDDGRHSRNSTNWSKNELVENRSSSIERSTKLYDSRNEKIQKEVEKRRSRQEVDRTRRSRSPKQEIGRTRRSTSPRQSVVARRSQSPKKETDRTRRSRSPRQEVDRIRRSRSPRQESGRTRSSHSPRITEKTKSKEKVKTPPIENQNVNKNKGTSKQEQLHHLDKILLKDRQDPLKRSKQEKLSPRDKHQKEDVHNKNQESKKLDRQGNRSEKKEEKSPKDDIIPKRHIEGRNFNEKRDQSIDKDKRRNREMDDERKRPQSSKIASRRSDPGYQTSQGSAKYRIASERRTEPEVIRKSLRQNQEKEPKNSNSDYKFRERRSINYNEEDDPQLYNRLRNSTSTQPIHFVPMNTPGTPIARVDLTKTASTSTQQNTERAVVFRENVPKKIKHMISVTDFAKAPHKFIGNFDPAIPPPRHTVAIPGRDDYKKIPQLIEGIDDESQIKTSSPEANKTQEMESINMKEIERILQQVQEATGQEATGQESSRKLNQKETPEDSPGITTPNFEEFEEMTAGNESNKEDDKIQVEDKKKSGLEVDEKTKRSGIFSSAIKKVEEGDATTNIFSPLEKKNLENVQKDVEMPQERDLDESLEEIDSWQEGESTQVQTTSPRKSTTDVQKRQYRRLRTPPKEPTTPEAKEGEKIQDPTNKNTLKTAENLAEESLKEKQEIMDIKNEQKFQQDEDMAEIEKEYAKYLENTADTTTSSIEVEKFKNVQELDKPIPTSSKTASEKSPIETSEAEKNLRGYITRRSFLEKDYLTMLDTEVKDEEILIFYKGIPNEEMQRRADKIGLQLTLEQIDKWNVNDLNDFYRQENLTDLQKDLAKAIYKRLYERRRKNCVITESFDAASSASKTSEEEEELNEEEEEMLNFYKGITNEEMQRRANKVGLELTVDQIDNWDADDLANFCTQENLKKLQKEMAKTIYRRLCERRRKNRKFTENPNTSSTNSKASEEPEEEPQPPKVQEAKPQTPKDHPSPHDQEEQKQFTEFSESHDHLCSSQKTLFDSNIPPEVILPRVITEEEMQIRAMKVGLPFTVKEMQEMSTEEYIKFRSMPDVSEIQKYVLKAIRYRYMDRQRKEKYRKQEHEGKFKEMPEQVLEKSEKMSEKYKKQEREGELKEISDQVSEKSKKGAEEQEEVKFGLESEENSLEKEEVKKDDEAEIDDDITKFPKGITNDEINRRSKQIGLKFTVEEIGKMTIQNINAFCMSEDATKLQEKMLKTIYRRLAQKRYYNQQKAIRQIASTSRSFIESEGDAEIQNRPPFSSRERSVAEVLDEAQENTTPNLPTAEEIKMKEYVKIPQKMTDDELQIIAQRIGLPFTLQEINEMSNEEIKKFRSRPEVTELQKILLMKIKKRFYDRFYKRPSKEKSGKSQKDVDEENENLMIDVSMRSETSQLSQPTTQTSTPHGSEPNSDFLLGFEEEDGTDMDDTKAVKSDTPQKPAKKRMGYTPIQYTCIKCKKRDKDIYMPTMPLEMERRAQWIKLLNLPEKYLYFRMRYPVCLDHFTQEDVKKLPNGNVRLFTNALPKDYRNVEENSQNLNEQGTENEELWTERILKNVYRKRPSIVGETEDEVNKPKKKSKKDALDENVGKADTNKEIRIPDRRYINGTWCCHDKNKQMLYNVDDKWVPVPDEISLDFKLKWNKAPSAKLLPNGSWGISGEIFDGVRKVFNEYLYEWVSIETETTN